MISTSIRRSVVRGTGRIRFYDGIRGTSVVLGNGCLESGTSSYMTAASALQQQHQPLLQLQSFRGLVSEASPFQQVPSIGCIDISNNNIISRRTYITRAHQPQPIDEHGIYEAIEHALKECQQRRRKRERKFQRNLKRQPGGGVDSGDAAITTTKCSHPDEMIELCINLNLDPRKPGQALRGSISLPHGTGKSTNQCIVFTTNEQLQQDALKAGALHAGGEALMDQILDGTVPIDNTVANALATPEVMTTLSKKGVARVLGPRGLMPNVKVGTLLQTPEELLTALATKLAGKEITYRTEKEGIVHVPIGKASFGVEKLLDNAGEVMKEIYAVKPENYGKGKKSGKSGKQPGKGTKYLLKAYLSSTQGKGIRLDPKTIDPSSAFFLASSEQEQQQAA